MATTFKSTLTLLNRSTLVITNVSKVIEANENLVLLVVDSDNCKIGGKNLQLDKLDIASQKVEILGEIDSVVFGKKQKKLFAKLLSK